MTDSSVPPAAPPAQYGQPQYAAAPPTNGLAIASLVSAFFISLLAVILGHIALGQIKRTGEGGKGLATAGLILGYIGLVVGLIAIIVFIASAAQFASLVDLYS